MFSRKKEITEAVEAIRKITDNKSRGEILTYDEIEILGIDRESVSYPTIVIRFKKMLLDSRQIAVRCENGKGFRLLTVMQQIQECARDRQSRIKNQASKGIKEVSVAPEDGVPEFLRRLKAAQVGAMMSTRTNSKAFLKEAELSIETSESLPRRMIPK